MTRKNKVAITPRVQPVSELSQIQKSMGQTSVQVTAIKKAEVAENAVLQSNAALPEDEFLAYYLGAENDANVIMPPYDLRRLTQLVQENNTLAQCIAAMEVNVDGTGYVIDKMGQNPNDVGTVLDAVQSGMLDFFSEPYPGVSFTTIRRQLRRDIETTGNAYLEVIRNPQDEIVFLRRVDSVMMRLVRLGEPELVKKKVRRNGKMTEINVSVRERRFVQKVMARLIYFKEFDCQRDLDKFTGKYAEKGTRLPANQRATEIIHFTCIEDVSTPYGLPRWISQIPSILGSRKAEIHNLEFFDSGGIPPVVVFLTGGGLTPQVRKQVEGVFAGTNTKSRGAVVEVQPISGNLDSTGTAGVRVERFGAERQNDSMFEKYDAKCEERTRGSFRLPPLFVGKAQDYSFATAYASYVTAEAQVFVPERTEFDEQINVKLMKSMAPEYLFRSLAMTVKDVEVQLKALTLLVTGMAIGPDALLEAVNEVTHLNAKRGVEKPVQLELNEQANELKKISDNMKSGPQTAVGNKVKKDIDTGAETDI